MINLSLLDHLIQNANAKPPSEDAVDEYFDHIVNCIEQENIKEAAKCIEKIFAKNVPDIRIIVYYFYAHFNEHGIKSFAKTFPLTKSLVCDHLETLTPKNRIDKHIQSSLNWFFSHILHRFKYYEKLHSSGKEHPVWKKSLSETSLDELKQLIEISREFNRFFVEKWPLSPTNERILHLIKKMEDIQKIVMESQKPSLEENIEATIEENLDEIPVNSEVGEEKPMDPQTEQLENVGMSEMKSNEPASVMETSSGEINFSDENVVSQSLQTPEKEIAEEMHDQAEIQNQSLPSFSISENRDEKAIGEPLHLFIESLDSLSRKLKIFEALIEKNDYLKAAIVANDIDHLVENFDPLNYFPKLFAKYFSMFAKHVTALTEQYENKKSLQIKALERLYRTDLEMFLDW